MTQIKQNFIMPGNVHLQLDIKNSSFDELSDYWADVLPCYRVDEDTVSQGSFSRTLKVKSVTNLSSEGLRSLSTGVLGRPGIILDSSLNTKIQRLDAKTVEIEFVDSLVDWLGPTLQLLMLEVGYAPVHCAGVAQNGKAILFPSWGGVGKTAITEYFINGEGFRLLGDDFVMISSSGSCLPFPKAMVLYPYHKDTFPGVFSSGLGPKAPIGTNNALSLAAVSLKPILRKSPGMLRWARKNNPQSVRISPSAVFGDHVLADESLARTVVWLERDTLLTEPKIEAADELFVSRIVGTSLCEASGTHCSRVIPFMFGLGIFSYEHTYVAWSTIVSSAFQSSKNWMISIPVDMHISQVPGVVRSLLGDVGAIED